VTLPSSEEELEEGELDEVEFSSGSEGRRKVGRPVPVVDGCLLLEEEVVEPAVLPLAFVEPAVLDPGAFPCPCSCVF
jgi:hypothetical protein